MFKFSRPTKTFDFLIFSAGLEDPHNEFFICGEHGVQGKAIWHHKYSIRRVMIPRFLSMTWNKIL